MSTKGKILDLGLYFVLASKTRQQNSGNCRPPPLKSLTLKCNRKLLREKGIYELDVIE